MRTTIRLDDDVEREIRSIAGAEGIPFGKLVNRLLRLSLEAKSRGGNPKRSFKEKPIHLGAPCIELTKALALAGQLEDDENLRKRALRN